MCLPELDSPSIGALLDPPRGGRFVVEPVDPYTVRRIYLERTNVLETTFTTDSGSVTLTDAVTMDAGQVTPWRELVRSLKGVSGRVTLRWHLEPRFDYGERAADFRRAADALVAVDGDLQLALLAWGTGESEIHAERPREGLLSARAKKRCVLVAAGEYPLPLPTRDSVARRLQDTCQVWRTWAAGTPTRGRGRPPSSAVSSRCACSPTGAPARSPPPVPPHCLRPLAVNATTTTAFAWVRDLSFTLDALMRIGMPELPYASLGWLLDSVSNTHPRIDPVYQAAARRHGRSDGDGVARGEVRCGADAGDRRAARRHRRPRLRDLAQPGRRTVGARKL